ncbi:hypothetical protein HPB51_022579 [Rhipicephalus microplus]|uniref:Uncharacterized protein n=1 Tax=Rhipicephalus microplus TaxID=6941 RepID=A0A9J6DJT1_RHIMP|nr:hypothetical protein HPB51_022579 [Rhipicephalus microplus]
MTSFYILLHKDGWVDGCFYCTVGLIWADGDCVFITPLQPPKNSSTSHHQVHFCRHQVLGLFRLSGMAETADVNEKQCTLPSPRVHADARLKQLCVTYPATAALRQAGSATARRRVQ